MGDYFYKAGVRLNKDIEFDIVIMRGLDFSFLENCKVLIIEYFRLRFICLVKDGLVALAGIASEVGRISKALKETGNIPGLSLNDGILTSRYLYGTWLISISRWAPLGAVYPRIPSENTRHPGIIMGFDVDLARVTEDKWTTTSEDVIDTCINCSGFLGGNSRLWLVGKSACTFSVTPQTLHIPNSSIIDFYAGILDDRITVAQATLWNEATVVTYCERAP